MQAICLAGQCCFRVPDLGQIPVCLAPVIDELTQAFATGRLVAELEFQLAQLIERANVEDGVVNPDGVGTIWCLVQEGPELTELATIPCGFLPMRSTPSRLSRRSAGRGPDS